MNRVLSKEELLCWKERTEDWIAKDLSDLAAAVMELDRIKMKLSAHLSDLKEIDDELKGTR